ncbi:MAG: hypothetical protein K5696_12970 [Lachnospiraceae bacterium]|nr:hypothetical protein [Lachnospiraceae bacterium]
MAKGDEKKNTQADPVDVGEHLAAKLAEPVKGQMSDAEALEELDTLGDAPAAAEGEAPAPAAAEGEAPAPAAAEGEAPAPDPAAEGEAPAPAAAEGEAPAPAAAEGEAPAPAAAEGEAPAPAAAEGEAPAPAAEGQAAPASQDPFLELPVDDQKNILYGIRMHDMAFQAILEEYGAGGPEHENLGRIGGPSRDVFMSMIQEGITDPQKAVAPNAASMAYYQQMSRAVTFFNQQLEDLRQVDNGTMTPETYKMKYRSKENWDRPLEDDKRLVEGLRQQADAQMKNMAGVVVLKDLQTPQQRKEELQKKAEVNRRFQKPRLQETQYDRACKQRYMASARRTADRNILQAEQYATMENMTGINDKIQTLYDRYHERYPNTFPTTQPDLSLAATLKALAIWRGLVTKDTSGMNQAELLDHEKKIASARREVSQKADLFISEKEKQPRRFWQRSLKRDTEYKMAQGLKEDFAQLEQQVGRRREDVKQRFRADKQDIQEMVTDRIDQMRRNFIRRLGLIPEAPQRQQAAAPQMQAAPVRQGVMPQMQGAMPMRQGVMPQMQAMPPQRQQMMVPRMPQMTPQMQGAMSVRQGVMPQMAPGYTPVQWTVVQVYQQADSAYQQSTRMYQTAATAYQRLQMQVMQAQRALAQAEMARNAARMQVLDAQMGLVQMGMNPMQMGMNPVQMGMNPAQMGMAPMQATPAPTPVMTGITPEGMAVSGRMVQSPYGNYMQAGSPLTPTAPPAEAAFEQPAAQQGQAAAPQSQAAAPQGQPAAQQSQPSAPPAEVVLEQQAAQQSQAEQPKQIPPSQVSKEQAMGMLDQKKLISEPGLFSIAEQASPMTMQERYQLGWARLQARQDHINLSAYVEDSLIPAWAKGANVSQADKELGLYIAHRAKKGLPMPVEQLAEDLPNQPKAQVNETTVSKTGDQLAAQPAPAKPPVSKTTQPGGPNSTQPSTAKKATQAKKAAAPQQASHTSSSAKPVHGHHHQPSEHHGMVKPMG